MTTFMSCSTSSTVLPASRKPAHRLQQIVEERTIDAGRRLVEQDQCGIGHEHTHELDELLLAVGEVARVLPGQPAKTHELQQFAAAALRLGVRAARDDEQVLQRRQLREDADDLERAPDAAAGDLPGLRPSSRPPRKLTRPASSRSIPVMQLKSVVLPEPLGPMRP